MDLTEMKNKKRKNKKRKLYDPFSEIPGTHLINLGRMKG